MGEVSPRRVAAFDFDGTLSRRDTLVPFLAKVAGPARFASACSQLGLRGARRRLAIRDRDEVKAQMFRLLFADREESDLEHQGELYARDLLSDQLRPAVMRRLEQHRERGDDTLFVSASLVYYLRPLARWLEIDDVIAVEPESVDGRLTGRLTHPNVRAEQKALRLREWLGQDASGPLVDAELWAYGNSSGDHALLEMADHAYWLGKPKKVPAGSAMFDPTPLD